MWLGLQEVIVVVVIVLWVVVLARIGRHIKRG
jgi:hypothetical protein